MPDPIDGKSNIELTPSCRRCRQTTRSGTGRGSRTASFPLLSLVTAERDGYIEAASPRQTFLALFQIAMTADPSPSSVTRERPLRLASSIGRGTCVIYWLALTFGLLRPHGGDAKDFASAFGLGEHPDLAHFLAFVLLALVCQAARWPWNWRLAVTTLVVYAVATELAQAWIPGRTADLLDGLANLLGLAVGMAVWRAGSGVANALSPRS